MINTNDWYAVQIRSNCESIARISLAAKGYEVFLPTYIKRGSRNGSASYSEEPLFKGYLFLRFTRGATGKAVTSPGLIRLVEFGSGPAAIDPDEIANVKLIAKSPVVRQPWKYMSVGTRVRIDTGPLRGLIGVLIANKDTRYAVVSISLLQRSIAITLDDNTPVSVVETRSAGSRSSTESLAASLLT